MTTSDDLIRHLEQPGVDGDPDREILRLQPDLTQDGALALQLAVKRRRVVEGDRIVGHQASFTSAAIRTMFPDAPRPMIGTLLASLVRGDGEAVSLDSDRAFIESEMALILDRDLEGPDLTAAEVLRAVDGFFPAIEVAPLRRGALEGAYSNQHMIAVQKAAGGFVVFGDRITPAAGFDCRAEGCLVAIDGEVRAGATGFEAMGSPLTVVAAMAAGLARIGEKLHAGQVVMTGSLAPPQVVTAAHRSAHLQFQTLGGVSVRFADPSAA
ncbi:MAG: fumarylacetoacetate hydrolase family protein [Sphingomonas adhaesiva]|uniref:2-keto-4-pentenoate hydratase n=1 Tax=Sphingomonas adhaesiva TaxID=28212 RepID=UPI002FF6E2CF